MRSGFESALYYMQNPLGGKGLTAFDSRAGCDHVIKYGGIRCRDSEAHSRASQRDFKLILILNLLLISMAFVEL